METIIVAFEDVIQVMPEGLEYRNESGVIRFVDFQRCSDNWCRDRGIEPGTRRTVGYRNSGTDPPRFVFYEDQTVRVEFRKDGRVEAYGATYSKRPTDMAQFAHKIMNAGWTGYDLS